MRVHLEGARLLSLICVALDDAGIKSVLMWGSLLGHIREGGIISHDHDIDLNMFDFDIDKIGSFEQKILDSGLELDRRTPYQMTVTYPKETRLGIDIWIFYSDKNDYTLFSYRKLGGLHQFKMPKILFDDCQTVEFIGVQVSVPIRAHEVLDLAYGDWRVSRPAFSDDDSPCGTIVGAYPVNDHSYTLKSKYSSWGKPLTRWPPYTPVNIGDRAPNAFFTRTDGRVLHIDEFAGRFVVLAFIGSLKLAASSVTLEKLKRLLAGQPTKFIQVLCVTSDLLSDESNAQEYKQEHDFEIIHDYDLSLARGFGALPNLRPPHCRQDFRLNMIVIDPARFVISRFGFSKLDSEWPDVVKHIDSRKMRTSYNEPPLLFFPRFLDEVLRNKIATYMNLVSCKSISDDNNVLEEVNLRISSIVIPQMKRLLSVNVHWPSDPVLWQFKPSNASQIAVRHNEGDSTSHRRFGVVFNLSDHCVGGADVFPEFSQTKYVLERGCALVFPASILHRVEKVTEGERIAAVVWLTDDEGIAMNSKRVTLINEVR